MLFYSNLGTQNVVDWSFYHLGNELFRVTVVVFVSCKCFELLAKILPLALLLEHFLGRDLKDFQILHHVIWLHRLIYVNICWLRVLLKMHP